MSNNGWFTMRDVLNDLTEVTGRRIHRIDNNFVVSGEQPPPFIVQDEESDFEQMYGHCASKDGALAKPDLAGIKHMLRMVNDYSDDSTYDENIDQLRKNANNVLCISKLNPNVPEFVPKSVSKASSTFSNNTHKKDQARRGPLQGAKEFNEKASDDLIEVINEQNDNFITSKDYSKKHVKSSDLKESDHYKTLVCKDGTSKASLVSKDNIVTNVNDASHETNNNNNDIDVNKKIDISSLNLEEIKNMGQMLKRKIIDTSKTDCLNKKREKNLAVASLLKLYTQSPPNSASNVNLMSPDYFKTAPKDESKTIGGNVNTEVLHNCASNHQVMSINDSLDAQLLLQKTKNQSQESSCSSMIQVIDDESHSPINFTDRVSKEGNIHHFDSMDIKQSQLKAGYKQEKHKPKSPANLLCPIMSTRTSGTSGSSSVDTSERPASTLTSDLFYSSSHMDLITEDDSDCKVGSQLLNVSTNTKMNGIHYLSQKSYQVSQESPFRRHTQDVKHNFNESKSPSKDIGRHKDGNPMPSEIENSIKKVDNWLNKPEKQKHTLPSLFLGPVTFKRKDTSASKNVDVLEIIKSEGDISEPQSTDVKERCSTVLSSDTFVPSSYADKLTKSYMERTKSKEARSEDMWTKLERQLKEKDKALKEKILKEKREEAQQDS